MSLDALLSAAKRLHEATPALMEFGTWPTDLAPVNKAPVRMPAEALIAKLNDALPLATEVKAVSHLLEWRRTYTADEVGQHFLDSYGYVELFGPHGHFHSTQLRGYIAYWDDRLDYGWHDHEAEEIYYAIHGHPLFLSKDQPDAAIAPGKTRHHASWEEHAMRTLDTPFFCYALWRGPGLAELPKMTNPSARSSGSEAVEQPR